MNNYQTTDSRKEGDVFLEGNSSSKEKRFKKDDGDYVNYEEIK